MGAGPLFGEIFSLARGNGPMVEAAIEQIAAALAGRTRARAHSLRVHVQLQVVVKRSPEQQRRRRYVRRGQPKEQGKGKKR